MASPASNYFSIKKKTLVEEQAISLVADRQISPSTKSKVTFYTPTTTNTNITLRIRLEYRYGIILSKLV